jgi:flagellar biosynthesis protein FliQ
LSTDAALRLVSDLLITGMLISLPLLGLTLVVGLLISVLQVITQIQEMSLTFVPKLIVATAVLIVGGPWMLSMLGRFTVKVWAQMANVA